MIQPIRISFPLSSPHKGTKLQIKQEYIYCNHKEKKEKKKRKEKELAF